jgi:hypothetical protein
MNLADIANIRLESQQITSSTFNTAGEIVHWMGAMQAQDYGMAKWAIGVRLTGSTDKMIEASLDKGEILRTHLLRPTWHFVTAEDISWMLALTAPHIKSSVKSRHRDLEITGTIIEKSNNAIAKALTGGYLTREMLVNELLKVNIRTDENRASHLLLWAELDGLICSGPSSGNKRTYTLLENCIPKNKPLLRDEALAKLAERYFNSHAPATLQDFIWWSGLPVTDAKHGFEMIRSSFISASVDSQNYWIPASLSPPRKKKSSTVVLPAYDEFIISYKNRNAALNAENHKKSISSNGIFRPVIVVNGKVTGIWKRTPGKDTVLLETVFSRLLNKTELDSINEAFGAFGRFLEKKTAVKHNAYNFETL